MAKTEVILTHNIVGLGAESDQVKVAAGYARNYLFPQGLAIPLTGANKRRLEALRQRRAEREAHELNTMTELAKSISKLICVITVKTGEDGKMFGTVTSGMIADQLKTQFDISLDKKKIHLEQPIRALGQLEVALRLHADVNTALKVRVESSTPLPAPVEAPAPEVKKEELKTEKRGRRPDQPGEKIGKPEAGKAEGGERKPWPARPERAHRPDHGHRPEKGPRPERGPRPEGGARPEGGSRPQGGPRPERGPRAEKAPRPEKGPVPEKAAKAQQAE
jgi:large subunit ribosomal protein L9